MTTAHRQLKVSDLSVDQRECYDGIRTWINRGSETKATLSLGGYAGCLSGDTMLTYNRGSRANMRPISLRDLYLKFNGHAGGGRGAAQRWVDLTVPTFLESMWPDGTVALNRVIGVLTSGLKKVIRIEFDDGADLILTEDHPIALPGGEFLAAGSLAVGDHVLGRGTMRPVGEGQGRRPVNQRLPRIIVNTKYHPVGAFKAVESNGIVYEYMRVARARLVVEAAMNSVSYDEFVHALKHNEGASKAFKFLPPEVDVHHVDEDTLNDDITNLEVLPHAEHARIHTQERNATMEYTRERKIVAVTAAGEEMTYDIQMEPPANNFVANGIIVHNTGKSALVSVLAHEMPSPLAFCAFTGKASSVLGRKLQASGIATVNKAVPRDPETGRPRFEPRAYCGTIHGLIYQPCTECMTEKEYKHTYGNLCREGKSEAEIAAARKPVKAKAVGEVETVDGISFQVEGACLGCDPPPPVKREGPCSRCQNERYLRRDELDRPYQLIVIDEASMVSDEMLQDLLSYGVPILAVGDHGQLPPVKGTGSLMKAPDLRLEKIHRQAAGNPIIALSARIREKGDIDDALEDGQAFSILSRRDLAGWISKRFTQARLDSDPRSPEGIMNSVLVSWTNRLRVTLNYDVRAIIGNEGAPANGEVVICLKNKAPIYNGMRGVLVGDALRAGDQGGRAPKWKATIDFVEDNQAATNILLSEHQFFAEKTIDYDMARELGVSMAQLGELYDFGYALTCHKMQGSQAAEVGVVVEPGLLRMQRDDRTRWLYTAVTRAADRLTVIR